MDSDVTTLATQSAPVRKRTGPPGPPTRNTVGLAPELPNPDERPASPAPVRLRQHAAPQNCWVKLVHMIRQIVRRWKQRLVQPIHLIKASDGGSKFLAATTAIAVTLAIVSVVFRALLGV
jgi:hypothetical protein